MEKLLNIVEVSSVLRVSNSTIRSWIFQQKIPVVRIGRRVLFRKQDVEKITEDGYCPAARKERE